jgi:hypothetical protein
MITYSAVFIIIIIICFLFQGERGENSRVVPRYRDSLISSGMVL